MYYISKYNKKWSNPDSKSILTLVRIRIIIIEISNVFGTNFTNKITNCFELNCFDEIIQELKKSKYMENEKLNEISKQILLSLDIYCLLSLKQVKSAKLVLQSNCNFNKLFFPLAFLRCKILYLEVILLFYLSLMTYKMEFLSFFYF